MRLKRAFPFNLSGSVLSMHSLCDCTQRRNQLVANLVPGQFCYTILRHSSGWYEPFCKLLTTAEGMLDWWSPECSLERLETSSRISVQIFPAGPARYLYSNFRSSSRAFGLHLTTLFPIGVPGAPSHQATARPHPPLEGFLMPFEGFSMAFKRFSIFLFYLKNV